MSTDLNLEAYVISIVAVVLKKDITQISRETELHLKHIKDIVTHLTDYAIKSKVRQIDIRTVGDMIDSLEKL